MNNEQELPEGAEQYAPKTEPRSIVEYHNLIRLHIRQFNFVSEEERILGWIKAHEGKDSALLKDYPTNLLLQAIRVCLQYP